ncbi:hypothetical protein RUM43_002594 [Polyplax serrata]|uniref:Uncharacterized protein n=1 Tax=Polyplax serrata TaxID=468196 RepID=A0AAN8RW09_POLSC
MSKYSRPVFSRPRTKVYDTNYNIGESYYKSALDGIDRKYGRGPSGPAMGGFFSTPMSQPMAGSERQPEMSSLRNTMKEMEDDFFENRKKQTSAMLADFDSAFEGRMGNGMMKERTPMRGNRMFDDDMMEDDVTSSMKRLKAIKIAKTMADEFEEDAMTSGRSKSRLRSKMDFSDKVMDSVGLSGRARAALEEEGTTGRRRMLKMTSDMGEGEELTKWTALKPSIPRKYMLEDEEDISTSNTAAAARARQSRARLEDLESEMQALSERSAAREKRVRDLKALVQENEMNALDNMHATVKVQSTVQSEKRVTF